MEGISTSTISSKRPMVEATRESEIIVKSGRESILSLQNEFPVQGACLTRILSYSFPRSKNLFHVR